MQSRWKWAVVVASVILILAASALPPAFAQPAPVPRAVVPADAAPESMASLFSYLRSGDKTISIPGAAWLQLQFSNVQLGPDGTLTIVSAAGDSQSFSQADLEAWGGLTAIFNGSELRVTLTPGPGATEPVVARVADIIIGLPPLHEGDVEAPQPLINLLGEDLDRFIPEDVRPTTEGAAPEEDGSLEAICGTTDDRVASNNPRSGRIMPVGCTGWLIDGGALLTAGHCTGGSMQTIEFNVPASQANGTTVSPPVRDQYRVIAGSVVTQNTGIGNDWAIFTVLPNTETGRLPAAAQGATFQLSNTENPANIRITGFGVDGPPPNFGDVPPRDATNQTQQTHVGRLSTNTGGANSGTLRHNVDTQGGNSGSPVIREGSNLAIGIHTNGGCTSTGGTNAGTSFRNQALWRVIGKEYRTDRRGSDYRSFDLAQADPNLCSTRCAGESQCKAWTYVNPGVQGAQARCWLKSSVPPARATSCCVSGIKAAEYMTDRPGSDYRSFNLAQADPNLCSTRCAGESQCKAWTYVNPGVQGAQARCWLKSSVPPARANSCCVSGIRSAP